MEGDDAGAKPFSELELKLDGRKAALDQAAKKAGGRREGEAVIQKETEKEAALAH